MSNALTLVWLLIVTMPNGERVELGRFAERTACMDSVRFLSEYRPDLTKVSCRRAVVVEAKP